VRMHVVWVLWADLVWAELNTVAATACQSWSSPCMVATCGAYVLLNARGQIIVSGLVRCCWC
jgi:hypothetical protein